MVNINKDIYSSVKKVDKRWIKKFNLAKAYYEKNGNLDIGYTCNTEDELSIFLYKQRLEDELATSVLDYGKFDYLAEFYLLQKDYENGVYDYYIEDEEEFILKFKDKLGVEIIK